MAKLAFFSLAQIDKALENKDYIADQLGQHERMKSISQEQVPGRKGAYRVSVALLLGYVDECITL